MTGPASVTTKVSAATVTGAGALSLHHWGIIIGIAIGCASFAYDVYHKYRIRKIMEKQHERKD